MQKNHFLLLKNVKSTESAQPWGLSQLCLGLVGGAGMVAGASYSADLAVFEPGAKHTFDAAAGKNVANPTAAFLAAAKLLEHVGLYEYQTRLKVSGSLSPMCVCAE